MKKEESMKYKDSSYRKEMPHFSLKHVFFSFRDLRIIFYISVIIVVGRAVLFIPIMARWLLTVWEDYTLFAVFVVLEVITAGVVVLIPVILVLYILLGYLLKKYLEIRSGNQKTRKIIYRLDKSQYQSKANTLYFLCHCFLKYV
ncbi:hypothetical protein ABID23_000963 [Bartonella silvatica]|uniref:Uncharacterized protein n=1 Tax=Bartonella silvatica TaxID=357760 RepID=A0ABV2HH41_9HYPH